MADANHSELWFEDGNVVLRARSDKGHMLRFRIHRFMLAHHSPVFRDMFAVATASGAEMFEGLPLVDMPDKSEDLGAFLTVLYNPSKLPFRRMDPYTTVNVVGVLRMATKYDVDNLRNRIIEHVQADWPQSLKDWDLMEDEIGGMAEQHEGFSRFNGMLFDQRLPEPAATIRLAHEFGLRTILPAALYTLARLDPHWDWDTGASMESPDLVNGIWKDHPNARTARWSILTADDLRCLARGQFKLQQEVARFWKLNCEPGVICDSEANCTIIWRRSARTFRQHDVGYSLDILRIHREFFAVIEKEGEQLCDFCLERSSMERVEGRDSYWDQLAVWFGQEGGADAITL